MSEVRTNSIGGTKLVEMRNVVKEFPVSSNAFFGRGAVVHAVSGVSLDILEGETFALVGESGCGKSTLGRLMLNLIPLTSGEIIFDGKLIRKDGLFVLPELECLNPDALK